jgi:hypothetical protein
MSADIPEKPPGTCGLFRGASGAAIGAQSRKVYEQDFTHGKPIVFIVAGIVRDISERWIDPSGQTAVAGRVRRAIDSLHTIISSSHHSGSDTLWKKRPPD